MKQIIMAAILLAFIGCKEKKESPYAYSWSTGKITVDSIGKPAGDTTEYIAGTYSIDVYDKTKDKVVVASSILVCNTYSFGWLPKGSVLYNPSTAQEGYELKVMLNDNVLSTTYCPKKELRKYIELLKYEASVKDSIVGIFKLNK